MGFKLSIRALGLLYLCTFVYGDALVTTILIQNNGTNTTAGTPETPEPFVDELYTPGKLAECGEILSLREGQMYQFRTLSPSRSPRSPYWNPYLNGPPNRYQHHGYQQQYPRHYPAYPYYHQQHRNPFQSFSTPIYRPGSYYPPLKPTICRWAFVTESNCDLVVSFDIHEVGDTSCINQYLLIGDEDRDIQVCGYTQFPGYFRSSGKQLFIKHYKRPGVWGAEFQGFVTCIKKYAPEQETAIDAPPTLEDEDEDLFEDSYSSFSTSTSTPPPETSTTTPPPDSSSSTTSTPPPDSSDSSTTTSPPGSSTTTPPPEYYPYEPSSNPSITTSTSLPESSTSTPPPESSTSTSTPDSYYASTTPPYGSSTSTPSPQSYTDAAPNPDPESYPDQALPDEAPENDPEEAPTPAAESNPNQTPTHGPEYYSEQTLTPAPQSSTSTEAPEYLTSTLAPTNYPSEELPEYRSNVGPAHKPYAKTNARAYADDEDTEAIGSGSGAGLESEYQLYF